MRNIVFLDIDGVLNSQRWNCVHTQEIAEGILIDQEKVKLLALLIHSTRAEIILHSGWRMWFDVDCHPLRKEAGVLVSFFAQEKLVIAGVTPDLTTEEIRRTRKFSLVKADEILAWLGENPDVTGWVVLDDLVLQHPVIARHQVQTDPAVGLSAENVAAAQQKLQQS